MGPVLICLRKTCASNGLERPRQVRGQASRRKTAGFSEHHEPRDWASVSSDPGPSTAQHGMVEETELHTVKHADECGSPGHFLSHLLADEHGLGSPSAFDVKVLALVPPPEISIHQGLWNYRYDLAENDEHYSDKWNAVEFWRVCRTRPYRGRAFNIWTQLLLAAMVTSILLNICSFLFSRRLYLLLGLLTGYGLLFAVITSCLTAWEYTTCLQELQSDRATGEPRYFLSRSYVTKLSLTGVSFMSILLAFACQLFRNLAALFVLLFHTANL
ncbi:unnamed protein product [Protopolystoma xenopodis]|uniref:Uncharacterized protein n=1 Tax=Protopolystoma xenopodis TaxID=117903 RepID=A0A3S5CIV7_9PLAT|nr:unnamed protein product [Protopolystoma xenopodis]